MCKWKMYKIKYDYIIIVMYIAIFIIAIYACISGGFRGARGPHLPSQDIQKDGCAVIKTLKHTNSCK